MLCGSLALILGDEMDYREVGDIDFVINERNFNYLKGIENLRKDKYGENEDDKYTSYHGRHFVRINLMTKSNVNVNLLVFEDDIVLNKQTLILPEGDITIQDVDTMLYYKRKYNRDKDKKDLENIANKCLEEIIAQ